VVIAEPVTSIDHADGNVIVTWEAPDNRSSQITEYFIEIQDAADSTNWIEDATYCNG